MYTVSYKIEPVSNTDLFLLKAWVSAADDAQDEKIFLHSFTPNTPTEDGLLDVYLFERVCIAADLDLYPRDDNDDIATAYRRRRFMAIEYATIADAREALTAIQDAVGDLVDDLTAIGSSAATETVSFTGGTCSVTRQEGAVSAKITISSVTFSGSSETHVFTVSIPSDITDIDDALFEAVSSTEDIATLDELDPSDPSSWGDIGRVSSISFTAPTADATTTLKSILADLSELAEVIADGTTSGSFSK